MRNHLEELLHSQKLKLENERTKILWEMQQWIDVDHSLHHGGTAMERVNNNAISWVLNWLNNFYWPEYPTNEEFSEIKNIINNR